MAQAQAQPMAQPAAVSAAQPAAQPSAQPGVPGQANMPPKQSGWMKWLLIIIGALIVVGGLAYWILAP